MENNVSQFYYYNYQLLKRVVDDGCRDAYRTHLQITNEGKMTNCTENYRLYPKIFCGNGWVRQKCCATARANCKSGDNVVG